MGLYVAAEQAAGVEVELFGGGHDDDFLDAGEAGDGADQDGRGHLLEAEEALDWQYHKQRTAGYPVGVGVVRCECAEAPKADCQSYQA